MLLRDLFQHGYRNQRRNVRADRTLREYETLFRQLAEHLDREATLADLNRQTVNAFLTCLQDKGRSGSTLNKRRASLLALWNFAMEEELIPMASMRVEKFPTEKKLPTTWSLNQIQAMMDQSAKLSGAVPETNIEWSSWWTCLILVVYDTGARISPVMLAAGTDYDAALGQLRLDAAHQKQKVEQVLRVSAQTHEQMERLQLGEHERLFPWPHDPDCGWRTLRHHFKERILRPAGLPDDSKHVFHCFRRTTATALAIKVSDKAAQRQLGHSSVAITREHYVDERQRPVVEAADVLDRPNLSKSKKRKRKKDH